jgi:hypothetical protein
VSRTLLSLRPLALALDQPTLALRSPLVVWADPGRSDAAHPQDRAKLVRSRFSFWRLTLLLKDRRQRVLLCASLSIRPEDEAGGAVQAGEVIGYSGSASGVDHLHLGTLDWRAFQGVAEG